MHCPPAPTPPEQPCETHDDHDVAPVNPAPTAIVSVVGVTVIESDWFTYGSGVPAHSTSCRNQDFGKSHVGVGVAVVDPIVGVFVHVQVGPPGVIVREDVSEAVTVDVE